MTTDVMQPTQPLQPLPQTIQTRVMEGEVIRPGQEVFLSFQGDDQAYIATVYSGVSYYYPTCGPSRVKIKLKFDGATLQEEDVVKIVTTEQKVSDFNTLGAFTGDRNCYYYRDNQGDKQLWQVTPLQRRPDKTVRFGDKVFLVNQSFSTQRLTRDGIGGRYLTTTENGGFWVIEQV